MAEKAQWLAQRKQDWVNTERCAFCECPVYTHKDGYAITPVAGVEHLCGVNCACRYETEEGVAHAKE